MKKKLLALLMTIAMLFSMLPSASFAEEVPSIPQPTETISAEEPTSPEQPLEVKPTESATPAPTEEPVATETPSVTEAPTATEEPAATVEPAATEEPAATMQPTATEEPNVDATPAPENINYGIAPMSIDGDEETSSEIYQKADIEGVVKWYNYDQQNSKDLPKSVTITLYANGIPTGNSVTLTSAANNNNYKKNWSFVFKDQRVYDDNGATIKYSVVQNAVEGYETTYTYTVTNDNRTELCVVNSYYGKTDKDHTFEHIDVRIHGAVLNLVYVDAETGALLDIPGKTITAYVDKVHSVTINEKKYDSGFSQSGNYEFRKTKGVSIAASTLNSNSRAIIVVDLKDSDGNKYENVEIEYGYGGIMAAAYDCNGYTNGHFDGLDFTVGKIENFSVKIKCKTEDITIQKFVQAEGEDPIAYTGKAGDFTFKMVETYNGSQTSTAYAKTDANGKATFSLVYNYSTDVGKTFKYVLTEENTSEQFKDNDQTYEFSVEIVMDGNTIKPNIKGIDISSTLNFTNVYNTTSRKVTKVWDDDDNRDGLRPDSIEVQLYANGEPSGNPVTVTAKNHWQYIWENLPEFANGDAIAYSVQEVTNLSDYTVKYDGMTIINSHTTAKINKTVTKEWDDGDNRDGIRPDSVTVQLLANGTVIKEIKLSAENEWKHTWTNLYKYENGKEIKYTVEEVKVPDGYTSSVNGNKITNSHEPELYNKDGKFTVTKVWNDDENRDGIRPDSIEVQLYADGTTYGEAITLNATNNWTYTWEQLYKYENGEEIKYTVKEVEVEGYTSSIVGGTITNTHDPEHFGDKDGFVTIRKEWNDKNNQDGKRSESIVVHLQADRVTVRTTTLSEANQWTAKFSDLPKYRDRGTEIEYTVVEEVANDSAYTPSYAFDDTNFVFTVTNTYSPETTNKTVTKKWADDDNRDAKRPESITVQLMADGQAYGEAVTLTAKDNWTYTWNNLPKYNNGKPITYSIEENAVTDYTAEVAVGVDGQFVLTNTHKIATISKAVSKVWNDDNNRDGIRPTSVTVQLMANGKAYGEVVTLNADNNWSYSWTKLPVNDNGKKIDYSIVETMVTDGYTADVIEKDGTFTLTNSHKIDSTSKTVTKVWNDDNNRDGIRPDSVTVQLFANGVAQGEAVQLTKESNWSYTWNNLPTKANGKEIVYTVDETAVDGYTKSIEGMTITNTHIAATTSISTKKIWNDQDNFDGLRPTEVKVQLMANGKAYGAPIVLNEKNEWSYSWSELNVFADGKAIEYSVQEVEVADGYTASYEIAEDGTLLIVNTHTANPVSKTVTKVWNDSNDKPGERPDSIKVQLYANGKAYGDVVEVTAKDGWVYTWESLPSFSDGKEIVYTVKEVDVPRGYAASYSDDTFTITNIYRGIPKTGEDNVNPIWFALALMSLLTIEIVLNVDKKRRHC